MGVDTVSKPNECRRRGDLVQIPGNYQFRALTKGLSPQRFWHSTRLKEALLALKPMAGETIVDAGCGSGILAARVAGIFGIQVIAVDLNPLAIEFAKEQFPLPNLDFRLGAVDDLSFPPQSIDSIVCLEVIEHLPFPDVLRMVGIFFDALKPGGRLVISTPNRNSLWPLIETCLDWMRIVPELGGAQHVTLFTVRSLRRTVESVGFHFSNGMTFNGIAPWLALFSWWLAEQVEGLEKHLIPAWGSIIQQVFEKP